MPLDKLIAVGLPIAIGVVMIDRGGRGQLHRSQIDPRFLRALGVSPRFSSGDGRARNNGRVAAADPGDLERGAIGSVVILLAAVMTLIATGHTCLAPSC